VQFDVGVMPILKIYQSESSFSGEEIDSEKVRKMRIFLLPLQSSYMKVHLLKKQTIENYAEKNARSRSSFKLWLLTIKGADWNKPENILNTFRSADLLGTGTDRVVFDIGGNNYRMICHYVFGEKEVHLFVCWIGIHAEYTKLCNDKKQYSISNY
jgi:mRNA interferase HigB